MIIWSCMFCQTQILQAPNLHQGNRIYPCKDKNEWHIWVDLQQPKVCIQILQAYFSLITCIHVYQSREPMIRQYLRLAQRGNWKDTVHSVYQVNVVFCRICHLDPKMYCRLNEDISLSHHTCSLTSFKNHGEH